MKKFLIYLIMIICYLVSNWMCEILNILSANYINLQAVALVLTILCSVALSFVSFYVPQKILTSGNGLRYKLLSLFTMIIGFTSGVSSLTTVYENIELFDIFRPLIFFSLLVFLINPTFIFGIILFVLYKKNYKNKITK